MEEIQKKILMQMFWVRAYFWILLNKIKAYQVHI